MRYAVCIPVGPGEADERRLRSRVEALFRHERAVSLLVIADASGNDAAGRLRELVPPTCQGVRLDCEAAAGAPCGPLTSRLMALRYLADREDIDVCVQLPLTALVVGPFTASFTHFFTANADCGLVGRLNNATGDGAVSLRTVRPEAERWRLGLLRRTRGYDTRRLSRLASGHARSAHVSGGGYALTRRTIAGLETAGLLGHDWPTDADEGRLVSALVLSSGYAAADLSRPGEVFGIDAAGLSGSPSEMSDAGYAIVGDVTRDSHHAEREIVAYFAQSAAQAVVV